MKDIPAFDITPDHDALRRMRREFTFQPASPSQATFFESEIVQRFNEDGFLAPLDLFSPDEIASHRVYFDSLLAAYMAEGKDSYSISTAHMKHRGVYDLLTNPRIVQPVRDLLGPNVVGWGSHYFCKMPGDGKQVSWHQDASYWPLTPSRTVTVWLAIDDADTKNGCMRVAPGTHLDGALAFADSEATEENVLNQTVAYQAAWRPPVDIVLKAGQASLHSDLLVHGSEANRSARRRCGLTLRYCSADVTAELQWNLKGVVVAGKADPDKWPGAAPPTSA